MKFFKKCGINVAKVSFKTVLMTLLTLSLTITTFAYFTDEITVHINPVTSATYKVNVVNKDCMEVVNETFVCPKTKEGIHTFELQAEGNASSGYSILTINDETYYTEAIKPNESITLYVKANGGTSIRFDSYWGESSKEHVYKDEDMIIIDEIIEYNPFEGLYISTLGDSISTYTGWSDAYPITSEDCTNRYGEAYYGPEGGDFHNTDLLVTDTWWHQAATQLGAEILMSNAGNSSGVFYASYPSNAAWDLYLKEMLAWKSRPYYLGRDGKKPDIIALYIGSNEARNKNVSKDKGSLEETLTKGLIQENEDGTYTYGTPTTISDAYFIMMHKVTVTYPDAEVYCFLPVPQAGGYLSTINTRMQSTVLFNETISEIADYYGAIKVDLIKQFNIDPDEDGIITQEDFEIFSTYYHNDPHPNAQGFDMITEAFVKAILENSKYNK